MTSVTFQHFQNQLGIDFVCMVDEPMFTFNRSLLKIANRNIASRHPDRNHQHSIKTNHCLKQVRTKSIAVSDLVRIFIPAQAKSMTNALAIIGQSNIRV